MGWRKQLAKIIYPQVFDELEHSEYVISVKEDELFKLSDEYDLLSEQLIGLQLELDDAKQEIADFEPKPTILSSEDALHPSESDKPSPNSNLSRGQAKLLANSNVAISGGEITFIANTNSMEPFIDYNSIIVLEKASAEDIGVGDFISYDGNFSKWYGFKGHRIFHRVEKVDSRREKWLLKGINNTFDDGWIPFDALNGRMKTVHYFNKSDGIE